MDALRRLIQPSSEGNTRAVRRVPAQPDRQPASRLRGPNQEAGRRARSIAVRCASELGAGGG